MTSLSSVILKLFNKGRPVLPRMLPLETQPCLTDSISMSKSLARMVKFVKRQKWWKRHRSYKLLADRQPLQSLLQTFVPIFTSAVQSENKKLFILPNVSHPHSLIELRFLSLVLKESIRNVVLLKPIYMLLYLLYQSVKYRVTASSQYWSQYKVMEDCQCFHRGILSLC